MIQSFSRHVFKMSPQPHRQKGERVFVIVIEEKMWSYANCLFILDIIIYYKISFTDWRQGVVVSNSVV